MKIDLDALILNCMDRLEPKRGVWEAPLTAVLSAEDQRLPVLKRIAYAGHLLPRELLSDAKSIIVYFIPFAAEIIKSNETGKTASEEWAMAYVRTNGLIGVINDEIEKSLNGKGFLTEKVKATHNFDKETLMSQWSHRHIAHLAGLGSFGINNMLITSKGCCGRFGSLLTNAAPDVFNADIAVEQTSSPMAERCLNKIDGSCGVCKKKCRYEAYKEGGKFDRYRCYEACLENAALYQSLGVADVCGKCLVGLPCSSTAP